MSGIIKRADSSANVVTSLTAARMRRADAMPAPSDAPAPDIEQELRRECGDLRAALRAAQTALEEAREKGRAEGYAQGLNEGAKQAEQRDEARLKAMADGIGSALKQWQAKLDLFDRLAPALASAVLEKLFSGTGPAIQWTEAAMARQLALLGEHAVVSLSISPDEFDADAVDALQRRYPQTEIVADPALRPSQCQFALKLGQIDLTVTEQQAAILALLRNMAGG